MVYLTVVNRPFLEAQGQARSLRVVSLPAFRGMIQDRHGVPLAVSSRVFAIWFSQEAADLDKKQILALKNQLGLSEKYLSNRIKRTKTQPFVYLKRSVSPKTAKKVGALSLPGVHLQEEFKRYYPEGESMAHVLGITDVDDKGLEGLELAFDDWLRGEPGKKKVVKDRLGHVISEIGILKESKPGKNLVLSLDRRIQSYVYEELKKTMLQFKAKSGSVVVLDAKTGEILAMANAPSFNPNIRPKRRDGRYRNRAVTDVFEPGSVMKAFSIASALESGKFQASSLVNTSPSRLVINGNTIRDDRDLGVISIEEILKRSSNVGVSKLVLSSPPEQLMNFLRKLGFSYRTNSGFPGEGSGTLNEKAKWRPFVLATMGFGYGISATTLQLAKAYSVFATGGKLLPMTFLKVAKPPKANQVVDEKVANSVLHMLESVVEGDGTGRRARLTSYRVAGKTGTARIASEGGYKQNRHIATFAGVAPVSQPRVVVAVMIKEPTAISYYGGVVAAGLFSKVMTGSLNYLGVTPDKITA